MAAFDLKGNVAALRRDGTSGPYEAAPREPARRFLAAVESEVAVYPLERHLLRRPENIIEAARLTIAWFDRHMAVR